MKFVNEDLRKYNKLFAFSLSSLFLAAIFNVSIFLYITNKSRHVNDITSEKNKIEIEIKSIEAMINKSESLDRIIKDSKLSGLSKNKNVRVLTVGNENIGLR